LKNPFRKYNKHLNNPPPKIISDIWESVTGAILVDGGI
jgi:dsRNA-specific ribonuclease